MYIASASPSEGKTTITSNIAIALANTGNKVLQIDADLRSPSLHHLFDLPNTLGLTNYLTGNTRPSDIAQAIRIVGLTVFTSGPLPPNPVELLASAKMFELMSLVTERFDNVSIPRMPTSSVPWSTGLTKPVKATDTAMATGTGTITTIPTTMVRESRRRNYRSRRDQVIGRHGAEATGTGIGVLPGTAALQPPGRSDAVVAGGLRPMAGGGEQSADAGSARGNGSGSQHPAGDPTQGLPLLSASDSVITAGGSFVPSACPGTAPRHPSSATATCWYVCFIPTGCPTQPNATAS